MSLITIFSVINALNIDTLFTKKTLSGLLLTTNLFVNDVSPKIDNIKSSVTNGQHTIEHFKNSELFKSPSNIKQELNNIYLYGPVTQDSCNELKNALVNLDFNAQVFKLQYGIAPPPIKLHIQSEGGSLLNAFFITDVIRTLHTPVYTYIEGYAASAASVISVVGEKRFITTNSLLMMHQLSSHTDDVKFEELDDNMKNLNMMMEKLKNIYLEHSNLDTSSLNSILMHDVWFDAKKCLEYNLVDEIL
jgi:ATP-dependent protease ClpP protease subunit